MNCIIIDDEPLALGIIKSYCEDIGGVQVLNTYTNPLDAIETLQKEQVDLVFLDIEMPQITGIDFVKSMDHKPFLVFTTAYPQYAIEGFELNAIDYLVKPIPFPRFVKAINRVKEIYEMRNNLTLAAVNTASAGGTLNMEGLFIFVKSDYDNIKIKVDDIKYIQGLKDYLKIHTHASKPILTLMSFKEMEKKLSSNNFLRVHRSFMVNINNIDAIQRSRIVIDDIRIPIGESYKEEFMRRIGL